jgi:hypothetical protein
MNFESIFEKDGKYTSDDFVKGFCFEIRDGALYGVQHSSAGDMQPEVDTFHTYKGLFKKDYRPVFTRQELFRNKD